MSSHIKLLSLLILIGVLLSCFIGCSAEDAAPAAISVSDLEAAFEVTLELTKNNNGYALEGTDDAHFTGTANNDKNITKLEMSYTRIYSTVADKAKLLSVMKEIEEENSASGIIIGNLEALGCYLDFVTLCETFGAKDLTTDAYMSAFQNGAPLTIGTWSIQSKLTANEEHYDVTFTVTNK